MIVGDMVVSVRGEVMSVLKSSVECICKAACMVERVEVQRAMSDVRMGCVWNGNLSQLLNID